MSRTVFARGCGYTGDGGLTLRTERGRREFSLRLTVDKSRGVGCVCVLCTKCVHPGADRTSGRSATGGRTLSVEVGRPTRGTSVFGQGRRSGNVSDKGADLMERGGPLEGK